MATIIDSLLVTLGLDATNFKKGEQEASKSQKDFVEKSKRNNKELSVLDSKAAAQREKHAKEAQAQGKKAIETFSAMRNQALSLLSVFVGGMGLVEFAKHTIFTTAALGRMSQNVGISVNELSGWGVAAKEMGGSAEGMMTDIDKASQSLAHLRTGFKDEAINNYFRFGGSNQHGELNDTKSFLLAIADLIHKINATDPGKAKMVASMLGLSPESFNLFKQGSAALREQIALGAQLSGQNQQNADDAAAAQKKWVALDEAMSAIGRKVTFEVLPSITNFFGALNDQQFWDDVFGRFERLGNALSLIKKGFLALVLGKKSDPELNGPIPAFHTRGMDSRKIETTPAIQKSPATGTRGMRNNNPSNIKYSAFARSHGAVGKDSDGFAIFPSMASGEAATQALLGIYLSSGRNTPSKVISSWAPSNENNTPAYIASVSKQTGLGADQKLSAADIPKLARAIYQHENGASYAVSPYYARLQSSPIRGGNVSNNTNSSEVHIGQIAINTQATDANGIAKDMGGALKSHGYLVGQANTGMQ